MPGPTITTTRATALALCALALLAAAVLLRYRPPPPKPADAPATEFSAMRAARQLAAILGDEAPHPIGTLAHAALQERLIAQMRALGLDPQIQRGTACERGVECGAVENLVARIDGSAHDGALLLAAHYDSVPAGPGAADDGAGVAALLEVVRALQAGPPLAHDLILLFSDGEEAGLLGARVFAAEHPWAKDVRAAINLEARGSSGPSFMFETGSSNAALMRDYAARVQRPITNSIYYTAYRLLPNDTDFSVFRTRDWQGYNFAWIGGVQNYHTPHDDLAHLSRAALQHQGDNALGVARALANEPWPQGEASDAVYVDLLAFGLLRWPAAATRPLAASLALLALAMGVALRRRGLLPLRALGAGLATLLLALPAAGLLDAGLVHALRAHGALPPVAARHDWTAHPRPLLLASAALAAFVTLAAARRLARRSSFWPAWSALLMLLAGAALASAWRLPGLSFAPLLTAAAALAGAPALLLRGDDETSRAWATLPALLVAALVLLPTLRFVYPLLGVGSLPVVAMLGVWLLLPLAVLASGCPPLPGRSLVAASLLAAIAAAASAALQPAYTAASPQRLNLIYALDADTGRAEWLARPDADLLPGPLAAAASFGSRGAPPFPWTTGNGYAAAAPQLTLAPPELQLLSAEAAGAATRYRTRLVSTRGATAASLCFAPGATVTSITLDAYAVEDRPAQNAGRCLHLDTLAAEGVELAFTLAGTDRSVFIGDRSHGLPPEGAKLLTARPAEAIAAQDGDETIVTRRVSLMTP